MDSLLNIEPIEEFENATEEILKTLYITKSKPSTNVIKAAKEELKQLIQKNNFDISKVTEALNSKEANVDKLNFIITKLNDRKLELLYLAVIEYNTSFGECVTDFDWALKLVLGTSELKTLRYPLLQLVLCSVTPNGVGKKLMYDVKKDVLAKLIKCLENVV